MRIILATNNQNKISEIKKILGNSYNIFSLKDLNININPDEIGIDFKENAYIKAKSVYDFMKNQNIYEDSDIILSDDSGFCIDYLDGAPGVKSNRYFGDVTDKNKNLKVIELLKGVLKEKRKAYFICVLCALSGDSVNYYEGKVYGYVADKITGDKGFGYDSIFIVDGYDKTFAELDSDIKNKISHRGTAFKKFIDSIERNCI